MCILMYHLEKSPNNAGWSVKYHNIPQIFPYGYVMLNNQAKCIIIIIKYYNYFKNADKNAVCR